MHAHQDRRDDAKQHDVFIVKILAEVNAPRASYFLASHIEASKEKHRNYTCYIYI